MAFRRSVPQAELRASVPAETLKQNETTYQASRGGHFPAVEKPVPGAPQEQPKS